MCMHMCMCMQVLSEFAAACRTTAVAISEGLIAPLSMGEPAQSDIYMYNGIFFSKAEDTKDSFKVHKLRCAHFFSSSFSEPFLICW